jgi:hypothetical protein
MLFTESGSFWVIVDGYLRNSISTTELDMRVSSHTAPRKLKIQKRYKYN